MGDPLLRESKDGSLNLWEAFMTVAMSYNRLDQILEEQRMSMESAANKEGRDLNNNETRKIIQKIVSTVSDAAAKVVEIRKGRKITTDERMLLNDAAAIIPEVVNAFEGNDKFES